MAFAVILGRLAAELALFAGVGFLIFGINNSIRDLHSLRCISRPRTWLPWNQHSRYVGQIPVLDANGDQFTIYEFRDRHLLRHARRFELCTGEAVTLSDENTFLLPTGEKLIRPK